MKIPQTGSRILVTGATGYVGGRLVPRLLAAGRAVRCLARDPERLGGRPWADSVEIVRGNVMDPGSLPAVLQGVEVAYYLIHSMQAEADFRRLNQEAARHFALAAKKAGVRRIVYLGGLGDPDAELSPHSRSRQETGEALRSAGVPVTELRAAVIVGSGSLSFEMIRALTERLPVMVCPRWVFTRTQLIAIDNVLDYLTACLEKPETAGRTLEIGGADILTYGQMMQGYARERGLRRWLIPVPVLTRRLSSYWLHLVTPVEAGVGRHLIESLHNEVLVRDPQARQLLPDIALLDYPSSVRLALADLEAGRIETTWGDALVTTQGDRAPVFLGTQEGMILERRQVLVAAAPHAVFRIVTGLGGSRGWLTMNWAWRLRGLIDRLVGGVGLRRGRRHPDELRPGDPLDFWRVEAVEPDRLLRLRAEMKVPGRAWLQFQVGEESGGTALVQTAFFAPRGLTGWLYWYGLFPIHALVFSRMVRAIGRRTESEQVRNGQTTAGVTPGGHRLTKSGRRPPPAPALPPSFPSRWRRTTADNLRRIARRPFRAGAPRRPDARSAAPDRLRPVPGR